MGREGGGGGQRAGAGGVYGPKRRAGGAGKEWEWVRSRPSRAQAAEGAAAKDNAAAVLPAPLSAPPAPLPPFLARLAAAPRPGVRPRQCTVTARDARSSRAMG